MLSRSLGIIIATWLPCLALMLPIGPFHTINWIAAGLAAAALSALSMAYDRARFGASLIGAWVAFTPFIFRASPIEIVISVCWGVTMFVSLGGPFSQEPHVTWVRAIRRTREEVSTDDQVLRVAA